MRAVLQRVTRASVTVDGRAVSTIGIGLVALVGVSRADTPDRARLLARKVHELRILREERSVAEVPDATVLIVSQFTLYGDVRKGRRPSWSGAASGSVAEPLIDLVAQELRDRGANVAIGIFGADMAVELVNDGPVTVIVEV
jgi:D-aminoacyl-tRNA deacylase